MWYAICSPSFGLFFHSFNCVFQIIVFKVKSINYVWVMLMGSYLRSLWLTQVHIDFSIFLLVVLVSCVIFRPQHTLLYIQKYDQKSFCMENMDHIFVLKNPMFQTPIVKTILPPLSCLWILGKNQVTTYVWLLAELYSIPLVYLLILTPVLDCFNHCNFLSLKVK